ncbi:MAG: hypothetical protein Kow0042_29030 [Calditrichia bacterium]
MNTVTKLLIILTFLYMFTQPVQGQQTIDARGVGMAFSNSAQTRGLEQVGLNPATLALPHRFKFEMNLLSFHLSASNNSFNKSLYDKYFTTGELLTEQDKSTILNAIPAEGIRGNFSAKLNTLAFYLPYFSIAITGMGNGSFTLPKELAVLSLEGNSQLDHVYDFSELDGKGWGGLAGMLSFAVPVYHRPEGFIQRASIGLSAKYIGGLAYFEVMRSEGRFQNVGFENPFVQIDGEMEMRTARGGSGLGLDLGFLMENKKWTFSLAFLNLLGSVNWKNQTEVRSYHVSSDSFAVKAEDMDDDVVVQHDSTYAIGNFKTRLPFTFDLGVAYQWHRNLLIAAEFEKGLNESMGARKNSRLAFGVEFTGIPIIPLRSGISLGGNHGFSFGLGTGLDLHFWYVDVGFMNHGGLTRGSAKGFTLSLTSRLRF